MKKSFGRWGFAVLALVGASTLVGLSWVRRSAEEAGELGPAQWDQLKTTLVQTLDPATEGEAAETAASPAPEVEAPPTPQEPEAIPPRVRPALSADQLATQSAQYEATSPKNVVALQKFRLTHTSVVRGSLGNVAATLTLVNLQPTINSWYTLQVRPSEGEARHFHLANGDPEHQDLQLSDDHPGALMIVRQDGTSPCPWLAGETPARIAEAIRRREPYLQLCAGAIALRLKTPGRRTTKEWTTDFLRDNVWGGEQITAFVRGTVFRDAYLSSGALEAAPEMSVMPAFPRAPIPARIDPEARGKVLDTADMGLALEDGDQRRLEVGRWAPLRDNPGVFASAIQARLVEPAIRRAHAGLAGTLDEVEGRAMVYAIAFDLDRFGLGYSVGTDHPRVAWSERAPQNNRPAHLPGPDGIGSIDPLVATGVVAAADAAHTVATFTGGFKRSHGAFRSGELARAHLGSHYGFVEQGVVLSKLQPGLATLLVTARGAVEMRTWTREDDGRLDEIRFARQNGVPLVETDPNTGERRPGALVGNWSAGNWSGSQDQKFRTLRAGACLQEGPTGRFLVYAYFSTATPTAMARVFQAYDCSYAMLLDMNALEHTYLAVYRAPGGSFTVDHLVRGMNVLDKTVGGTILPRFLGFADNRDFFYVTRRSR